MSEVESCNGVMTGSMACQFWSHALESGMVVVSQKRAWHVSSGVVH